MEIKKEAKTILVNYECDVCGELMKSTGSVKLVFPPLYEHRCPKCGEEINLDKSYPTTEYEELK